MRFQKIIHAAVIFLFVVPSGLWMFRCGKAHRHVLYINSYHRGYAPSDSILAGLGRGLSARADVELDTFYMDLKRLQDEPSIIRMTEAALSAINRVKPDVLIVSDDNAVKYLVAPHFRKGPLPVVFCGVNWSSEPYGLPTETVTGMVEVLPIEETVKTLRVYYPQLRKVIVISENSMTERKSMRYTDELYRALGFVVRTVLVDNFNQWKRAFLTANANDDAIFLPTNGAIQGWDDAEAADFVFRNIKKPVFTCDDFMMRFCVFGLTKVASEQGEWAAQTALRILNGEAPGSIPSVTNVRIRALWNAALAERIRFRPSGALREQLQTVD